jgi:hypothetical protein
LAIAIYSNETFEADDERLNYESYKKLSLICGECREAIFLKKGEVRSPHFSHFRDTDKNSHWRKGSDSSTQDTDSENRKQSLGKFPTKFKGIIERGIIQYQQISYSRIRNQIANGKILVAQYKIEMEVWLRWFNENSNNVENIEPNF